MRRRIAATATVAALTLPIAALAAAAPATAATTITLEVGCSAVNVRTGPSTSYTAVGVGYYGDKDLISKATAHNGTYTWWYGTLTRHSDGRKVTGWVTASCMGY